MSDVILDEVFLFLSFFLFLKNVTNTSAVSSAGVVDTQLCKLRDTSGSFVLCFMHGMVVVSSAYKVPW